MVVCGSHGKVQDGGLVTHGMYRMVVLQSWQGTGGWSESHGKVQDVGLKVMARYRMGV